MSDSKQYITNDIFSQLMTTIDMHKNKYSSYAKEYELENENFTKDILNLLKTRIDQFIFHNFYKKENKLLSDEEFINEYSKIIDPIKKHQQAHTIAKNILKEKFNTKTILSLDSNNREEFLILYRQELKSQGL